MEFSKLGKLFLLVMYKLFLASNTHTVHENKTDYIETNSACEYDHK